MLNDLRGAFAFLTILPVGTVSGVPGRTFAWYPLVGLGLGLALAGVASLPFDPDWRAFLLLLLWIILTGGLHLDGFADSCDGLFATATRERRLEIMKDPRAGSWAVIGLIVLLLGKWLAIRQALPVHLILAPVMGRLVMVGAAYVFPYARLQGIGGHFRQGLGRSQLVVALVTAILVVFSGVPVVGLWGFAASVLSVVGAVFFAFWAASRLGGLTGDVYGALCELTELLALILLTSAR